MADILIVPGLGNSGPEHWQTWLETLLPGTLRVVQDDWERAVLPGWAARVGEQIDAADRPVWLIAHSFGCLATVAATATRAGKVRGVLLVAPADPDRFAIPEVLLEDTLPCPSLVVASDNDPWVGASTARRWAERWGSRYFSIGKAAHINAESGHGPWPAGLQLFEVLQKLAA